MGFTQVDELIRPDHYELTKDDDCLFLREYQAGKGFDGETNSIILNLKKKPSEKHKPGYQHKARCIKLCASELKEALNPRWLDTATLVPIPGSKAIGHPDFDNRIEKICRQIRPDLDVRNLVKQTQSTDYSHNASPGERLSVEQLLELYEIDEDLSTPEPVSIGVIDDVLTVGRHFRAMHTVLSGRFENAKITGIFIARTIHQNPFEGIDPSDIF